MKWKPDYARLPHPPVRAVIIIDEAYRNYNSRDFKNFSTEEHTYFATNRHNELEIYLIAQNPARLDVTIREISQFILCRKIGFLSFILGFKLQYFEFMEDLSRRKAGDREAHYRTEFIRFSKTVAQAYDTHYFGINSPRPFVGELWIEEGDDEKDEPKKPARITYSISDFYHFYRNILIRLFQLGSTLLKRKNRQPTLKKEYDLFE